MAVGERGTEKILTMDTDTSAQPTQLQQPRCRYNPVNGSIEILHADGLTCTCGTADFWLSVLNDSKRLAERNAILEFENSRLNPARGARELVEWLNGCARMFEKSGVPGEITQAIVFRAVASKAKELIAIPE